MVIELRLIRNALVLGQYGNFARAAEALHLTQPSLSRSIAALEEQLGVPLFDRTRKGVVPTAFGRVLLERGDMVLRREADLRREIGLLAAVQTGSLTVGAGPYMNEVSVARALGRVAAAYPQLQVECRSLHPAEVVSQVLAEQVDVGVSNIAGLDREERLAVEPLPPQRIYLACRPGHPLTQEAAPTLRRALQFPLVTTRLRGEQAALALRQGSPTTPGDAYGQDYTPRVLVNSIATARLVAQASDLLVPGTAAALADDLAAGRLVRLECSAAAMRTNNGLLYLRRRTLAPAAQVFIQALKQVEAEDQAVDAAPRRRRSRALHPVIKDTAGTAGG
jgi:DNA-binding transcriptional LysR family regulator